MMRCLIMCIALSICVSTWTMNVVESYECPICLDPLFISENPKETEPLLIKKEEIKKNLFLKEHLDKKFEDNMTPVSLACHSLHIFHIKCIREMCLTRQVPSCPLCRHQIMLASKTSPIPWYSEFLQSLGNLFCCSRSSYPQPRASHV